MKLAKRRHHAYISYGEDPKLRWKVRVIDARETINLNGTLADALMGEPGLTIGCHLSNCAMRNRKVFKHKCYLAAFTRSRAYIVSKIDKNNIPIEAVEYVHRHSEMVDLNDTDASKSFIRKHPELAERSFTLEPVHRSKHRPNQVRPSGPSKASGNRRVRVPNGAMRRAMNAGLIKLAPGVVKLLNIKRPTI